LSNDPEPRAKAPIDWGPTLDADACTGCGICIGFCHNDVYAWEGDKVLVAHKAHCVTGCSHCATLCEAEALAFPTLADIKRARRGG
jgi:NAD-dependent dihydropyrimidine dehydrogenase PreA subunit